MTEDWGRKEKSKGRRRRERRRKGRGNTDGKCLMLHSSLHVVKTIGNVIRNSKQIALLVLSMMVAIFAGTVIASGWGVG